MTKVFNNTAGAALLKFPSKHYGLRFSMVMVMTPVRPSGSNHLGKCGTNCNVFSGVATNPSFLNGLQTLLSNNGKAFDNV